MDNSENILRELIDKTNINIEEWNNHKINEKIQDDIDEIINQLETEVEREQKLQELAEDSRKTYDMYRIGAYSCMNHNRQEKIRRMLKGFKREFGTIIPNSFRWRNALDYNEESWDEMLINLLVSIHMRFKKFPEREVSLLTYAERDLKKLNKLNTHCFISLRARMRYMYIEKYIEENAGSLKNEKTTISYRKRWSEDRDKERFKLLDFFDSEMSKNENNLEDVVKKIFYNLKKKLGLDALTNLEASKKIKKITDYNFFDDSGMLRVKGIGKNMSDARIARNKKSQKLTGL